MPPPRMLGIFFPGEAHFFKELTFQRHWEEKEGSFPRKSKKGLICPPGAGGPPQMGDHQ